VAYRFSRSVCVVLVALSGLAVGGSGCSAQGEGDRCTAFPGADPSINGNDECQDGLVCTPAFNTMDYPYDRCCPPVLSQATVPACEPSGALDGGNPTSGRDSSFDGTVDAKDSTSDIKTSDTKSDASKDGASDASPDSSPDSPSDGKSTADSG
jgi:hypothetical protein